MMDMSCSHSNALQMLFRCRNIKDRKFYLCVDPLGSQTKKIIPDEINDSLTSIKKYINRRDVIYRLHTSNEEYQIPLDMMRYSGKTGLIDPNDSYFNLYCGYIQDLVRQYRSFLFFILLYLRDQGFQYEGYSGDEPTEELKQYTAEFREFKSDKREEENEGISIAKNQTTLAINRISEKPNKTKDEIYEIKK